MNKNLILGLLALVVLGAGGYWVLTKSPAGEPTVQPVVETYIDTVYGFTFSYRGSPGGYVWQEPTEGVSQHGDFKKSVVLMLQSDYEELEASTEPREGPPSISISVYRNSGNLSSGQWAETHQSESNFGLKIGEVREVVVGGASAVRYLIDGLYPTNMAVIAYGGFVYVVSGSYLESGSTIHTDFDPLLESLTFIPSEEQASTGERVRVKLGQKVEAQGAAITPREILEDSRCPTDVTCIQAGTVRVRSTLTSGLGTAEQIFELGVPVTTEAEEIVLAEVEPVPVSTETREDEDYLFHFEIKKR